MKDRKKFILSSISGKIGVHGVVSIYNFTNEENLVQYSIEINDDNKSLLNKYELKFATEKFTFDEISTIGSEFKTFIPNKNILASVDTSYRGPGIAKCLGINLNFKPEEPRCSLNLNNKTKTKMETRNIKITIETATRWFNGCDKELKDLAAQTYPELVKKELPKTWEELGSYKGWHTGRQSVYETAGSLDYKDLNDHKFIFATKEQAEASLALAQLSQLMKVYNDGWVPDWSNKMSPKDCICIEGGIIVAMPRWESNKFLSFKDKETRDLFLKNFRDLIEQAKPLL